MVLNIPVAGVAQSDTFANTVPTTQLDTATMAYLAQNFGTESAWYTDPLIGKVLQSALTAGKNGTALAGLEYQDYIKTHYYDPASNTIKSDTSMAKTWWGQHSASVRLAIATKNSDPSTYKANIDNLLSASVNPVANSLGIHDQAKLRQIAETAYINGWTTSDQIKSAILQDNQLVNTNNLPSGDLTATQSEFQKIADQYGIPMPNDAAERDRLINAVSAGGSTQAFTDYAKTIAKAQFPWMSASIDAGITPKQYLTPYAINIANTLDISPDAIKWSDPKWSSLLQPKVDPSGKSQPTMPTFSDVIKTIKSNAQYRYDYTTQAKSDAYNLATDIKKQFGYEA